MPLLEYGDVLYMNASAHSLHLLDAAYHGALRFITGCKPLTHHCTLCSLTDWSSLSMRRTTHWYLFVYKSIIGLLPSYLSTYMTRQQSDRSLRSLDYITFAIPSVRTEQKGVLLCCAWNLEQAPAGAEAVQLYFAKGLQIMCRKAGETVSGGLHMYLTSSFSLVLW